MRLSIYMDHTEYGIQPDLKKLEYSGGRLGAFVGR